MRISRISLLSLTVTTGCLIAFARADDPARFMIEATVHGNHLEGSPLAWSDKRIWLLAHDGRLWDFAPREATNYRKTASYFNPYSAREMTAALQAELGRKVEVTATAQFLVALPPGKANIGAIASSKCTGNSSITLACAGPRCASRRRRWWRSCSRGTTIFSATR